MTLKIETLSFHKLVIISLITILIIPLTSASADEGAITYKYTSGQAKITTSDITIKVTGAGNVPQFFVYAGGSEEAAETTSEHTEASESESASQNRVSF